VVRRAASTASSRLPIPLKNRFSSTAVNAVSRIPEPKIGLVYGMIETTFLKK